MPELPEVETVKRSLISKLPGVVISDSYVGLKRIIRQQPVERFLSRATHAKFVSLNRRAKFIYAEVEQNDETFYMIIHLGMSGKLLYTSSVSSLTELDQKHAHVVLKLNNGDFLVYSDARTFGGLRLFTKEELDLFEKKQRFGPEPFWENAKEQFIENAKKKSNIEKPIKAVIMDHKVVTGIGNIYACESLFSAKIHPNTPVKKITDKKLKELFEIAKKMLLFSIELGGSSTRDYIDANGKKGSFQDYHQVYQKEYCPVCSSRIEKVEIAKRNSFFCPVCQPKL